MLIRSKTLVDYFRYTFLTFLHYNCTIILIHQHSMDSSHHHPHSTPKLVAFFKAHKSPGNSDVLGCKEAARHRQQLCDYCTFAKLPHCLHHLQSGKCCFCPQQDFDLIWFDWLLTLSLETVFTKSTNNQSLEMTALAEWVQLALESHLLKRCLSSL